MQQEMPWFSSPSVPKPCFCPSPASSGYWWPEPGGHSSQFCFSALEWRQTSFLAWDFLPAFSLCSEPGCC